MEKPPSCYECGNTGRFKAKSPIWKEKEKKWKKCAAGANGFRNTRDKGSQTKCPREKGIPHVKVKVEADSKGGNRVIKFASVSEDGEVSDVEQNGGEMQDGDANLTLRIAYISKDCP